MKLLFNARYVQQNWMFVHSLSVFLSHLQQTSICEFHIMCFPRLRARILRHITFTYMVQNVNNLSMFLGMRGIFLPLRCLPHKVFMDSFTFISLCNECSYILCKQQVLQSHARCNLDTRSLHVLLHNVDKVGSKWRHCVYLSNPRVSCSNDFGLNLV